MKVGLLKKGFLSIALAVALLVSLMPLTALADDPAQSAGDSGYTFTLVGYEYGRSVDAVNVTGSTLVGYFESKVYESYDSITGSVSKPATGTFKAEQPYYLWVKFEVGPFDGASGLSEKNVALTFDGESREAQKVTPDKDGDAYTAVFKLPPLEATPFPIPSAKMFVRAGGISPAEGSFELKVLNSDFEPLDSDFTVKGLSFATEGSHSFGIESNDFSKVLALLGSGIYVSEKNLGAEGWSYDDAVWRVSLKGENEPATADLTEGSQNEVSVITRALKFEKGKIVDGAFVLESQSEKMIFVNTYDPVVSLTLPFAKKVTQGGTAAPSKEAFELEIFDIGNSGAESYADVTYTATVNTDGAGEFAGELTITGPASQIDAFVSEGFFVREVKGAAKNWTYSDAVWFVAREQAESSGGSGIVFRPALSDAPSSGNLDGEVAPQLALVVYPTMREVDDQGEKSYSKTGEPVAKMSFENVCTAAAPATLAKTGDSVNTGLLVTLLLVSGCVFVGAAHGVRKKLVK